MAFEGNIFGDMKLYFLMRCLVVNGGQIRDLEREIFTVCYRRSRLTQTPFVEMSITSQLSARSLTGTSIDSVDNDTEPRSNPFFSPELILPSISADSALGESPDAVLAQIKRICDTLDEAVTISKPALFNKELDDASGVVLASSLTSMNLAAISSKIQMMASRAPSFPFTVPPKLNRFKHSKLFGESNQHNKSMVTMRSPVGSEEAATLSSFEEMKAHIRYTKATEARLKRTVVAVLGQMEDAVMNREENLDYLRFACADNNSLQLLFAPLAIIHAWIFDIWFLFVCLFVCLFVLITDHTYRKLRMELQSESVLTIPSSPANNLEAARRQIKDAETGNEFHVDVVRHLVWEVTEAVTGNERQRLHGVEEIAKKRKELASILAKLVDMCDSL
jgi:hypothetical protein